MNVTILTDCCTSFFKSRHSIDNSAKYDMKLHIKYTLWRTYEKNIFYI